MTSLNHREEAFLEAVKSWAGQPNTELYLAGSQRGRIDLNESIERFTIRDEDSMSPELVDALKEMGAIDLRVGPETTFNMLNQLTQEPLKASLQEAANDRIDESIEPSSNDTPSY